MFEKLEEVIIGTRIGKFTRLVVRILEVLCASSERIFKTGKYFPIIDIKH